MANLRVISQNVVDSTTIQVTFTENLNSNIGVENITITSLSPGVPNGTVMFVYINKNVLTIKTLPLTSKAVYKLTLASTLTRIFKSINGSVLFEDGNTNAPLITGAPDPDNFIFDRIVSYLKDTPYDTQNPGIIRDYINILSEQYVKAFNDIRQAKSDNYLSILVTDELHQRSEGPFDRLNNEGAYEILRVGLKPTGSTATKTLQFDSFPDVPITLQQISVVNERLIAGAVNTVGTFNDIVCTLKHNNIIKIDSILIQYSDGYVNNYDIRTYGYQIKNSRYDRFASTYVLLENNQFRFTEKAILAGFRVPKAGDHITVSYKYKNTGISVDKSSIKIYYSSRSVREVCPALLASFSTRHAPITDINGNTGSLGNISFLDPMAIPPFSTNHPAFQKEIPFDQSRLPLYSGEYSIDYLTGKVYVYGIDNKENIGTGKFPPACSYYYLSYYQNSLDYTYDEDLVEVAASSQRDLIGHSAIVSFDYSEDLVDGVDFKSQIHTEILSERINNNLIGYNAFRTQNTPITNVFRVFNETSGEAYPINRFNDTTIYFNYKTPPATYNKNKERTKFEQITNELLLKSDVFSNTNSIKIFKLYLQNNNIIANTEDSIASSINTSVFFTNTVVFSKELYFERDNLDTYNYNKITTIGQYVINYVDGIIYVGVADNQIDDVGAISYKSKYITTDYPHILSVNNVYTQVSNTSAQVKYEYNSFSDTKIDLKEYVFSDNYLYSTTPSVPLFVINNSIQLSENASAVRHIYDSVNLRTSLLPIDFGSVASVSDSLITLSTLNFYSTSIINIGQTVNVNELIGSPGIKIAAVNYIKRTSDGYELYNTTLNNGSFSGYTITLPTDTLGAATEAVYFSVSIYLDTNTTVVVDYDRGGLYVDYTFLNDEIIVSYEYGDNKLDFRESTTVSPKTIYYVTYRYGALRSAIFNNFTSLIKIDEFSNFSVDVNRERYRDAVKACLYTFPNGPTVGSISSIAQIISHVVPDIIESYELEWILGQGYLYKSKAKESGDLELIKSKFDYGVNISNPNEYISIPFESHMKLEQGTLEFFVAPNWDGLDNDATLTMKFYKNGIILSNTNIWIGESSFHPTLDINGKFNINRKDLLSPVGLPNKIGTELGVFVYYDTTDKKWKVITKDLPDGAVYRGSIDTSGEFYNSAPISGLIEVTDKISTTDKQISFSFKLDALDIADGYDGYIGVDGYVVKTLPYSYDGISFMSDDDHYFVDYGNKVDENRFSIYKDGRGYLNFKIFSKKDRLRKPHIFQISKDISSWKKGDQHFIATSWIINSKNKQDEMHLFVDGLEVPNVFRYGGRPITAPTDVYRTPASEIISTPVPKNTLANNDLVITAGSDVVYSLTSDFPIAGINVGDSLWIENPLILHPVDGYFTITQILTGNSVQLNYTFGYSLSDVSFSVNRFTTPTSIELMYESNIAVYASSGGVETELPGLRARIPSYSIEISNTGQPSLVVKNIAKAGDTIIIRTLGLNHRRARDRKYVWGNYSNIIRTQLAPPINLDYTKINTVILPKYSMNPTSSVITPYGGGTGYSAVGIVPITQPSNAASGRILAITVIGRNNVNFADPILILINGTTFSGAVSETLTFNAVGTQYTTESFKTITDINAIGRVYSTTIPSFSFEVKEKNPITISENDAYGETPIIRYSYNEHTANDFVGTGDQLASASSIFYNSMIGMAVFISSPPAAVGSYTIIGIIDEHTLQLNQSFGAPFVSGVGDIFNISIARSGFANGLFTFEVAGSAGVPYYLKQGYYDFDYTAHLEIPFELKADDLYIGSDYNGLKQANSVIDEMRSLNQISTDTRVGEVITSLQRSITTDYNTLNPYTPDENTILLMHFDKKPFTDSSLNYVFYNSRFMQSDFSVNTNFGKSLYVTSSPLVIDNKGIFDNNHGTIEFWVSPDFDTYNDPRKRVFFDGFAGLVEETISLTKRNIQLNNIATQVYSVTLINDDKINYADGGYITTDGRGYVLGKELPNNQTLVRVIYIPSNMTGDRVTIYKSEKGECIFEIIANNKIYALSTPILWPRGTWHRVMATWVCNTTNTQDEMRLFVDGQEKIKITFGMGLTFATPLTFGAISLYTAPSPVKTSIKFINQINTLFVGTNILGGEICKCRIDNLKISNYKKLPITILGQNFDNDYNSNIGLALPVIEDVYTTYIMDFETEAAKIEDFAILKNRVTGRYDFQLKVIDSFGIVRENNRVKELLEALIKALKPANSRSFITYV